MAGPLWWWEACNKQWFLIGFLPLPLYLLHPPQSSLFVKPRKGNTWKNICVLMETKGFTEPLNTFCYAPYPRGCALGMYWYRAHLQRGMGCDRPSNCLRSPSNTRRHQEPDCEIHSGQGPGDSVAVQFTHTHGSILVYVLPKRAQHTHMDQINKYLLSMHFVLLIFENIHLAVLGLSCGMQTLRCSMWNLVPWAGVEPRPPALGVWSLNQWSPCVTDFRTELIHLLEGFQAVWNPWELWPSFWQAGGGREVGQEYGYSSVAVS